MIDYANRKPKPINYGQKLQIRIDSKLFDKLTRVSENLNTEKSSLVREALEMYLNVLDEKEKKQNKVTGVS